MVAPSHLLDIAKRHIHDAALVLTVIGSEVVTTLTIAIFMEYLFDLKWTPDFLLLVSATQEWRRELAVKGVGDARIKRDAVLLMQSVIMTAPRFNRLFDSTGTAWRRPEFYSVIMQPFIISPAINVSDIMVACSL